MKGMIKLVHSEINTKHTKRYKKRGKGRRCGGNTRRRERKKKKKMKRKRRNESDKFDISLEPSHRHIISNTSHGSRDCFFLGGCEFWRTNSLLENINVKIEYAPNRQQ